MTIHGPGSPIYMSEIQAEFGGGNPMYLSNYYAGGPYVPAGTTGTYGPIPSSGNITLQHFYGASKYFYTGNLVAGSAGVQRGFNYDLAMGSLSPTALAGTDIRGAWWNTSNQFVLQLWANIGNAGFNNLILNGGSFVLSRGSGAFSITSGGSTWIWGGVGNPFTTGANHTLNFN